MPDKKEEEKILSRIPIPGERSQEYIQHPDGRIERRCYAPHNPHYYMDSVGAMHPIELDHFKASVTKAGESTELKSRNIVSVGRKTGDSKEKYLGLRPDFNQDSGDEQLEFDLSSVRFNGKRTDLDIQAVEIFSTRQRCRQLVPSTDKVKSFRVEFKIYLTGLKIEYKPELDEYWILAKDTGEFRFRIRKPVLVDTSYNVLHPDIETRQADPADFISHSLTDNGDDTYTYIKESLPGFEKLELPENYFIDADTYYAETSDGYVYYINGGEDWATVKATAVGTGANDSDAYFNQAIGGRPAAPDGWTISRSFFIFDTSGVIAVLSADFMIRGYSDNSASSVCMQEGTQAAALTTADYNNFTGNYFGRTFSWSVAGYNTISFNTLGKSKINVSGNTKICVREYSYDYGSSTPTDYTKAGCYFADQASTEYDPYLSITEAPDPTTVTTQACSETTTTYTTGNGEITDIGGENASRRGFCYLQGTSGTPTTANSIAYDDGDFGVGPYTKTIPSLSPGTSYRVRAYAVNGGGTSYGATVTVLTLPAAPTNVSATDGTYTDKVTITWTKSTGATGYKVYEGSNLLDTLGDVATYNDSAAAAPTITSGNAVAGDGASTAHISLSIAGSSANNGASRTYKVVAFNATGNSADSSTNAGYRGVGALTYQWQRSAGDSDAGYGNILGATSATHNDTAAPAGVVTPGTATAGDGLSTAQVALSLAGQSVTDGAGRYYQCILNATGCVEQTTGADRGYRTTGALTYQWQRSSGDSDADYSNIAGADTASYNDTDAPAGIVTPGTAYASDNLYYDKVELTIVGDSVTDGAGRYYKCVVSATGAADQNSVVDRGYRTTGVLTYQWYRSAGDAAYTYSLLVGATTEPYDDITIPAPTITPGTTDASDGLYVDKVTLALVGTTATQGAARYYYCEVSATGAETQETGANRGYRKAGTLAYQWQRSAADSDAAYSDLVGATASTYDDTTIPANVGRYYQCILDADGCTQQISAADRGHLTGQPTLTSPTVINIEDTQAVLGANLTDAGGAGVTERGIVWALTTDPTVLNNKVVEGGTAEGIYTDTIIGLPIHTAIYFRGYAINPVGTGYSETGFFSTSESIETGYPAYIITNLIDDFNCNTNALTNPGFETGDPPDDWTATGTGVAIERSTDYIRSGTYSAKLTNGAAEVAWLYQTIPSPDDWRGKIIILRSWLWCNAANRIRVMVQDYNGVSYNQGISAYHTGSGWECLEVSLVIRDESLTFIQAYVAAVSAGASIPFYFDDAVFIEGDSFGIQSSTENAYYPLENLYDKDMANPFRWTSAASGYIEIDFGTETSFDFIGLLNHSFTSTVTVTVTAGDTPAPSTVVMTFTHHDQNMFKYSLYTTSARFVRIAWTDSAGAAIHGIGELIIGRLIILTSQFNIGFIEKLEEGKIRRRTHKGVQETFNLYSLEAREYFFGPLNDARLEELETLHITADGSQYPFIWIPDIGGVEILYCKKSNEFRRQNISASRYESQLTLREQSRGVEVLA